MEDLELIEAGPEVEEFANALDECVYPALSSDAKKQRLLELPHKYYENTLRRLAKLRPARIRSGTEEMDMDGDDLRDPNGTSAEASEYKQLEREAQTWDLLRRVLPLRYSDEPFAPSQQNVFDNRPPLIGLFNDFLETDRQAQEVCAVLQWLQMNAQSRVEIDELVRDLQQNADRGDIIAHGWLHTRSAIKLRKSMTAWPHLLDRQSPNISQTHTNAQGSPMVTQLDPDAVKRQGKKLEPSDDYFERAIWLGLFEHMRRGSSLEAIRTWCGDRTEMWRAISMSAMMLSMDRDTAVESNPRQLALWRRMCLSLTKSKSGGTDDFERAVYGVLAGEIPSVEKVCVTWDDYLFANFNGLLRSQLDQYVLKQCAPQDASSLASEFPSFDATHYLGDDDVVKKLIRNLASRPAISKQAKDPFKALQASIVARDVEKHLSQQGHALAIDGSHQRLLPSTREAGLDPREFFRLSHHQGLRLMTHVFLLTSKLDDLQREKQRQQVMEMEMVASGTFVRDNIVVAYTEYLRKAGLQELIPLYCSMLEPGRGYGTLATTLIQEENIERRGILLRLMKKADIDVRECLQNQARSLLFEMEDPSAAKDPSKTLKLIEDGPADPQFGRAIIPDFFGSDEDEEIDPVHEHVIRSLEWLLMVKETWPQVFAIGVRVYKWFLHNFYLSAARRLMERIPFESIMNQIDGVEFSDQDLDDVAFWAQLLERDGVVNVTPQVVMLEARTYRELEVLVKALDNLETIASMAGLAQEIAQREESAFKQDLRESIDTARLNMAPLLQGWLLACIQDGDSELAALRKAYLPETILAYISALHYVGVKLSRDYLLECMELASQVAAREADLTATIQEAGRMRELVNAFTACSRALAIHTGTGRVVGSSGKKVREMGWSRDLWSVKS